MRIAIVSTSLFTTTVGGVENYIRYLVHELAGRGHELRVFVSSRTPDAVTRNADGLDVTAVRVPLGGLTPRGTRSGLGYIAAYASRLAMNSSCRALVGAVRAYEPDVVWQQDLSASWCAVARLGRRYPVVLTNHTGEFLEYARRRVFRPFVPLLLRPYDAIIGPSEELTPTLAHARYIPNGVDTARFTPVSAAERWRLRRELGVGEDTFLVLCPRRWAPTKGVVHMARAAGHLEGDILLATAGDECPEYPSYVREVEAALEVARVPVRRLGSLAPEALLPWHQAADVTVVPSLLEATSLSALESMACGVPVVASDVGGLPAIVRDGETGVLVPPEDPQALAAAITRLAADAALRAAMGARGRVTAVDHDWTRTADKTEEVLRSAVLRQKGTAHR